ncbi:hypothetical protein PRUPE_6G030000 [Prunus persica]|uniref:Uncharacterized protein n=1 Tax=Prunus persica TaxID=3760 RepID=A0A251NJE5_PRUPE|nr:hypothetical protein PRUPE_6G030000 [Prunus persica]
MTQRYYCLQQHYRCGVQGSVCGKMGARAKSPMCHILGRTSRSPDLLTGREHINCPCALPRGDESSRVEGDHGTVSYLVDVNS